MQIALALVLMVLVAGVLFKNVILSPVKAVKVVFGIVGVLVLSAAFLLLQGGV